MHDHNEVEAKVCAIQETVLMRKVSKYSTTGEQVLHESNPPKGKLMLPVSADKAVSFNAHGQVLVRKLCMRAGHVLQRLFAHHPLFKLCQSHLRCTRNHM